MSLYKSSVEETHESKNLQSDNPKQKYKSNSPMPGIDYFHPLQSPPSGTFLGMIRGSPNSRPLLFQPITIRDVTFQNRIWVSPMCQYSSDDGNLTDWHVMQLGSYASRGASLVMVEAAAVTPGGRTSPQDAGLWKDNQIPSFRRVISAIHSQGQKAAIQLAHGGRKSSMLAPWLGTAIAGKESNGFVEDVIGPSSISYDAVHPQPREMTIVDIQECIRSFADAAQRAILAGCDVLEIHAAHGYLIHSFLSPVSNLREDDYGGCFANRIRFALEITSAIRDSIPVGVPLFFRLSASDCLEHGLGWNLQDSIELSKILSKMGVDLVDVSSGGLHPAQKIVPGPGYQLPFANKIKQNVSNIYVASVGMLHNSDVAHQALTSGAADVVFIGREFSRNPSYVLNLASELGVRTKWPIQLHRAEPSYRGRDQSNL